MDENTPKPLRDKKKEDLKKKRLFVLIAVIAVIALLVFLNTLDFSLPVENTPETTVYAPPSLPDYHFYEADYETDILTLPAYQSLNRTVSYTFQNQTVVLSTTWTPDEPYSTFFLAYFAALQKGFDQATDSEEFNRFYSEVYFRKHPSFVAFAPQKVYDIEIERISDPMTITAAESEEDKAYLGATLTRFEVRYKILYNDGTFRRDIIGEDVIPQIITLLCDKKGNVTINSIAYSRPVGTNPNAGNDSGLLPYLMPLIWLIGSILFLTLFLILRKKVLLPVFLSFFITFFLSLKGSLTLQLAVGLPLLLLSVAAYYLVSALRRRQKTNE